MNATGSSLADQALRDAEKATGHSGWGPDDTFLEGLGIFLDALEGSPEPVKAGGWAQAVGLLSNRLAMQADAVREPGMLEVPITAPIFVVGNPRTGTTLMHELLALDPANRAPLSWEVVRPSPPPDIATFDTDPRIAIAQAEFDAQAAISPVLAALHPWGAVRPQECSIFTMMQFDTSALAVFFDVPRYLEWYVSDRPVRIYQFHRRVLQQLQWRGPRGRWVLKCPNHLLSLPELFAEYPDACVVQTHRDPYGQLGSTSSMIFEARKLVGLNSDRKVVGKEVMDTWSTSLDRAMGDREDPALDARCFDVAYTDAVNDPVGMMQRVYQRFGIEFTDAYEKQIQSFVEAGAGAGHGRHHYDPADFGVRRDEVYERLATYRAKYAAYLP